MRRFLCGVDAAKCQGSPVQYGPSSTSRLTQKAHSTEKEAIECHAKALLALGYTRLARREFSPPDGGPVLLLPKRWPTLRRGKGSDKAQGRVTPTGRPGENGFIVPTPPDGSA